MQSSARYVWAMGFGLTVCACRPGAAAELVQIPSALISIIDSVDVAAASAGLITELLIREGELAAEGDVLAQVDDREAELRTLYAQVNLRLAREEAEDDTALRLAEKTHEVAVKELERAQEMNRRLPKSVAEAELALLRLAVDRAALEIESARYGLRRLKLVSDSREAELLMAELIEQRHRVVAPLNGMVVRLDKRAGEWVEPGTVIARLVRIDKVRVEGFVPAAVATQGLVGNAAGLQLQVGDQAIMAQGQVVFVSPEANPVNGEVRVWSEFENVDLALRPGLRGTLTIRDRPPAGDAVGTASPGDAP